MAKIDTAETKNSLFGGLKAFPVDDVVSIVQKEAQPCTTKAKPAIQTSIKTASDNQSDKPKWLTLDKVTVLLTPEQKAGLDVVAKKIMKYRAKDLKGQDAKERITSNTIIRALIDRFLQAEEYAQMEVLPSESDVQVWITELLKRN